METRRLDLSAFSWRLAGYTPTAWSAGRTAELDIQRPPEFGPLPAPVPGSVQRALKDGGLLPDWNVGLNSLACEWVENRDWVYSVDIPAGELPAGSGRRLCCLGLDGFGVVLFNARQVGEFRNAFVPFEFDLSDVELRDVNRLDIVFTTPPRFLGTPQRSSEIREWKPRFNYTWDWMPRNVQIGPWDRVYLEAEGQASVRGLRLESELRESGGMLSVRGDVSGQAADAVLELCHAGNPVHREVLTIEGLTNGLQWQDLPIAAWQPNGYGEQPLYEFSCELRAAGGEVLDVAKRRIGFKHVQWLPCRGAASDADPWVCQVNGVPVFLAGVNWTPIRAHFADVTVAEYRRRLELYADTGFNVLRVWGGAVLEKQEFYDLCDELGLLVWQEFPLSSSGPDNRPPDDPATVAEAAAIARSYVRRRRHHVSLLMWCGGNELQTNRDGTAGCGLPLDTSHPMLGAMAEVCRDEDPLRRFVPTSSSGPVFIANEADFGRGIHWDVHGPWRLPEEDFEKAAEYWRHDDALFRSETGAPATSSAELIRTYAGDIDPLPVTKDNLLWRRFDWWVDDGVFRREHGRNPESLDEYVAWSRDRQARALEMAVGTCRDRFPGIGGIILWMGHDSFPCPANTSIVDFNGDPKPAVAAIRNVLRRG